MEMSLERDRGQILEGLTGHGEGLDSSLNPIESH